MRDATAKQLAKLIKHFGSPWAQKSVVPHLVEMAAKPGYLARLTSLFAISVRCGERPRPHAARDSSLPCPGVAVPPF